ncbi:MAG TPA: hypothetical protein VMT20_04640 [Terriglobia bacterium]|nr:hypothetical protein [Terriglobia bacterium]
MRAVLKLKGDILADAELPLVFSEIEGLVGGACSPALLSCSLFPAEFRQKTEFCTLLTRKVYKGSVQAFAGALDAEQLDAVRRSSAYVSDIFAWMQSDDTGDGFQRLLQALGVCSLGAEEDVEGPGFRIYRRGGSWLAHVVPVYWYLEYAAHALSYCASPRHTEWAASRLLNCPFVLTRDRLSAKIYGEQSYTTNHFTHGLHQYKGKFFPRMVRALLNADRANFVVDPFCGSGTLQAEATSAGYRNAGFDLNPLAVNICEMKAGILTADSDGFDSYRGLVAPQIRAATVRQVSVGTQGPNFPQPVEMSFPKDLASSLTPADLSFTHEVKAVIDSNPCPPYSQIFLMILSDALKSKVRVRVGGKTAFFYAIEPNQLDLRTRFRESLLKVSTFLHLWERLRDSLAIRLASSSTCEGDARSWPELPRTPDSVITSPPYFPYTGISYVYTNLAAVAVLGIKNPRALEERMIGNTLARSSPGDRAFAEIPEIKGLYSFLEADKHRNARIPVYADYFRNMFSVFGQMKSRCAPGAHIRFVVAKFQKLYRMHENRTLHEIDCVAITRKLAELAGLAHVGQIDIPLFKSDKVSLFPSNEGVEVVLHFRT